MIFYIDWENREVLSEEEIDKRIGDRAEELLVERDFVNDFFDDESLDLWDIFNLSNPEKEDYNIEMKKRAKEYAEEEVIEYLEEFNTDNL